MRLLLLFVLFIFAIASAQEQSEGEECVRALVRDGEFDRKAGRCLRDIAEKITEENSNQGLSQSDIRCLIHLAFNECMFNYVQETCNEDIHKSEYAEFMEKYQADPEELRRSHYCFVTEVFRRRRTANYRRKKRWFLTYKRK